MKSVKPLMLLPALLFWGACCTKKECVSVVPGIRIVAVGDSSPLDSVLVCRYEQHTSFAQPLDSFWTDCSPSGDPAVWILNYKGYGMELHSDYKVAFPKAGRTFYIDQFQRAQRTCNTCLFTKDTYEILDHYSVDGVAYPVDKSSVDGGIELHF
jgi:hypothetical protein